MHIHDHEDPALAVEATRAKVEGPDSLLMKAALAGRPDVMGRNGVIGLQRAAGNAATAQLMEEEGPSVHDVVSGSGSELDTGVRKDMESRMGQDFSDVRVHTGDTADASAKSVSAHAYTVGSNIVFQRGSYDPDSSAGKTMLAHELTHVVQQRNGPVEGTPVGGGVSVSDPSDRFEREASANAEAVMAQPVQRHAEDEDVQTAHDASLGPVVQREEAEEEEPLQASHDSSLGPVVQRDEEGEEEEMTS